MTIVVLAQRIRDSALRKAGRLLATREFGRRPTSSPGRERTSFSDSYALESELGRGGFGVVFAARRLRDGQEVAVKFVAQQRVQGWARPGPRAAPVPLEVCFLLRCSPGPGVVTLLDYVPVQEGFLLVLERLPLHLGAFLARWGALAEQRARFLFRQLLDALRFCLARNVLHQDIKVSENPGSCAQQMRRQSTLQRRLFSDHAMFRNQQKFNGCRTKTSC